MDIKYHTGVDLAKDDDSSVVMVYCGHYGKKPFISDCNICDGCNRECFWFIPLKDFKELS